MSTGSGMAKPKLVADSPAHEGSLLVLRIRDLTVEIANAAAKPHLIVWRFSHTFKPSEPLPIAVCLRTKTRPASRRLP